MEYIDVNPDEFAELTDVADWVLADGVISSVFEAPTYLAAGAFVLTIAEIAEARQHHPDLELRYPGHVHVALTTHATSGLTTLDLDVARLVSTAAADAGLTARSA